MPVIDPALFGLIDGERENAAVASCFTVWTRRRSPWDALRILRRNQQRSPPAMAVGGKRILLLYGPTRGIDVGTNMSFIC
jgi:hypothetical protein